jgi:phenylacetate-CoA ligase
MMRCIRKPYHLFHVNKNQWKTYDELKKLQLKKLKKIIHHAYYNVPFYHDLFKKNNLLPSDIKTLNDLNKIPIISKEEVKFNYPQNIISKHVDFSKCKIWQTSGSTGLPMKTAYDQKADDFAKAVILRSYIGNGLKYFDRWCVLGPDDYIIEKGRSFFISQKIGLLSPFYVSIFDNMDKKISMIKSFNPRVFDSLSTDLYLLAKYIEEHDIEGINPEIVTTNGEILTDAMRRYINKVFNVELSDLYGCYEFRRTGWECPKHEGYHIDVDSVITQFIKDGEEVSSGERGNIVFSGLYNYAMPLIRYDIADIGIPSDEKCSCGRGLPLMNIIEGKLMDFFIALDGTTISPYTVKISITDKVPGIQLCRIIQYSKENIKMLIVKNKDYTPRSTIIIQDIFKKFLGDEVNISIEFVEEIERVGRKYKFLESRISSAKII